MADNEATFGLQKLTRQPFEKFIKYYAVEEFSEANETDF